jgi:hypothetical protein
LLDDGLVSELDGEGRIYKMNGAKDSTQGLTLLSRLLVAADANSSDLTAFASEDFRELWRLAMSHHVIVRAFPKLDEILVESGDGRAEWVEQELAKERSRIALALSFLSPICRELETAGDVVVIKSLDHWPDLGSDLDLYTNAEGAAVVAIMRERFKAQLAERSWGDRLANKWNFIVPGLPELVEIHVSRLGQTGEQIAITQSLVKRAGLAQFGSYTCNVPAPEDRMIISTLQRMYRHFYVRLCDIVDNGKLIDSGVVDYPYLKSLAESAGLWAGLATYLVIISGYVKSYRGEGLSLPSLVTDAAQFGNELVHFRRNFLRIPIFPQSARFYASEWTRLLLNGELRSTLRLSLLPGLATAAALEMKMTGSDKGIW